MANDITLELKAKDTGVERELDRTQGLASAFGSKLTAVFTGITAAIQSVEFAKKIFDWGAAFVAAASEAEQNEARLGAVLRAVGTDAGFTKDQLMELSAQMQATTRFEDDLAQKAIAAALAFKNVRGDVFKDMLKAAADMAEATGGDLVSSTDKLARALNDPEKGMMRLRAEGVKFTDQQMEMVKSLQASGDMVGAQNILLDELKSRYGGVAEAMGNTAAGQVEKLKNRFGDMSESIGGMLLPFLTMLTPLVDMVATGLENCIPIVEQWVNGFKVGLDALIETSKPTLTWLAQAFADYFAIITVGFTHMGDVITLATALMMRKVVSTWEDFKHLFTHVLPEVIRWFSDNWVEIFTDLQNFQNTVLMNMGKNVGEFIMGVKRWLQTGSADFRFTALTEGFEMTLKELPQFKERAKTTFEKTLDDVINDTSSSLMKAVLERSDFFMNDLFKKKEKTIDMKTTESKVFDVEVPKAEKEKKEKEEKEAKEKKEEKEKEAKSGFEDIVALNKRITAAAAQGSPEQKIEKAVLDAGRQQAEKLDVLINVLRPVGDKLDKSNDALNAIERKEMVGALA